MYPRSKCMLKVKNASTGSMRVTSFVPVFHFYTPKGFFVFSEGTEIEHNVAVSATFLLVCFFKYKKERL